MLIRSVRHEGLKRFIEANDARDLRPDLVNRIRNILAVLISSTTMSEVMGPPGWRVHQLLSDREGTWSMSVSGNRGITFDLREGEITDLNLEDYH